MQLSWRDLAPLPPLTHLFHQGTMVEGVASGGSWDLKGNKGNGERVW
jgi:hypothetical protein